LSVAFRADAFAGLGWAAKAAIDFAGYGAAEAAPFQSEFNLTQ